MRFRLTIICTLMAMLAALLFAGCSQESDDLLTAPAITAETVGDSGPSTTTLGKPMPIPPIYDIQVHYDLPSCTAWITWRTQRSSWQDKVHYGPVGGPYQVVTATSGRYHTSNTFDYSSLPVTWEFKLTGTYLDGGNYSSGPHPRKEHPLCAAGK